MDEEKVILLKKFGFQQVDDDFWLTVKMPLFYGEGFTWAYPTPEHQQNYMPYSEDTLTRLSIDDIKQRTHLHNQPEQTRSITLYAPDSMSKDDVDSEIQRLHKALASTREQINRIYGKLRTLSLSVSVLSAVVTSVVLLVIFLLIK